MLNRIPTEEDWDNWKNDKPYDCVSTWNRPYAKKHFLGISLEDACSMFERDFMVYYDDFCDMPTACFTYYFSALCIFLTRHLKSHDCHKHGQFQYNVSDAASCFFSIINYRIKHYPNSVRIMKKEIERYAEDISQNQTCFEADLEIYGSFLEKAEELKLALSKL